MRKDLLLDTHVLLWLMNGEGKLSEKVRVLVREAAKENYLYISSISIWEIGLLERKNKITFNQPLNQWIDKVISLPYIKVINLDYKIALESTRLPGEFHGDPADRIIVATARIVDLSLLTRDRRIIDYSGNNTIKIIEV